MRRKKETVIIFCGVFVNRRKATHRAPLCANKITKLLNSKRGRKNLNRYRIDTFFPAFYS